MENGSALDNRLTDFGRDGLTLCFALASSLGTALTILLTFHLWLVKKNRTTLEFYLELQVDDRLPTIKQGLQRTGAFKLPGLLLASAVPATPSVDLMDMHNEHTQHLGIEVEMNNDA
eukprot:Protomagalhaensia_wolfi_Nauph_80__4139@NODE_420_length_2556_cov_409_126341_g314_i0_p4_GENE_NODE_420_length_2556_cov_409_126341_g314_i0NODE_420_length_2556_cov_409_126341_g314_i0_p4_ORF_typecomplete_len117_score15_40DHHC/PF01529_20/0_0014_NODE_420_length_2556_cov_409_126341_g314_i014961846